MVCVSLSVFLEGKEDSSSVVSPPDAFAAYLHLPYMGHTCFLFQQEEERDHFLSALKICIRHCNLGKTLTCTIYPLFTLSAVPLFEICSISAIEKRQNEFTLKCQHA